MKKFAGKGKKVSEKFVKIVCKSLNMLEFQIPGFLQDWFGCHYLSRPTRVKR